MRIIISIILVSIISISLQLPDEEKQPNTSEGFDNTTNGFTTQKQFDEDKAEFEDIQTASTGLGPLINSDSCVSCHNNPVTGGSSTVTELRVGSSNIKQRLIHNRALDPSIQEKVNNNETLRGLRIAPSVLGLGFIECIDSNEITRIRDAQSEEIRGELNIVIILEANFAKTPEEKKIAIRHKTTYGGIATLNVINTRVGRFGHKAQHASLISFSADAYLGEMGVTSPVLPVRNFNPDDPRKFGRPPDPVDKDGDQGFGNDVEAFARFMRSTKVPPRDGNLAISKEGQNGLLIFYRIGCAGCHKEEWKTLPQGDLINAGTFKIPSALGSKTFSPFSDFLLHDIGTGDGITQGGLQSTSNKFRTTPLWGLRTRPRLMHDGASLTRNDAILRHGGQATNVREQYKRLSVEEKEQLLIFLRSL